MALQLFMASDLKFDASKHSTTYLSLPVKDPSLAGLSVPAAVAWARAGVPRRMVTARAIRMPRSSTGANVPFAWAQAGREGGEPAGKEQTFAMDLHPPPGLRFWGLWGKWTSASRWWSHSYVCCWSNFVALTLPASFGPMRFCWAPDMVHESSSPKQFCSEKRGRGEFSLIDHN